MKRVHHGLDDATLRFNLWLTQVVVIGVALIGSLFVHGWADTLSLFRFPGIGSLMWAIGVAAVVVGSSIGMDRFLPPRWQDDGSINERIFSGLYRRHVRSLLRHWHWRGMAVSRCRPAGYRQCVDERSFYAGSRPLFVQTIACRECICHQLAVGVADGDERFPASVHSGPHRH